MVCCQDSSGAIITIFFLIFTTQWTGLSWRECVSPEKSSQSFTQSLCFLYDFGGGP